ncbi:MAG: glycoside hydrolase family 127 protein [Verrucomicrobiota bacterium]|nr:glycoside hydrolase family 127 protein [Verrucomicrobiota bacterium]
MIPINLNKLTMYNELAMRANSNFARLETWRYWPETIFEMDQHAWPADWEGRTMLALTMHAQATGRAPAFLDEILDTTLNRLNEKGYIGPVHDDGVTHEQAMAGHSWMLRALVEYVNWKKDSEPAQADKAMTVLNSIVEGLYIPQAENYTRYPIELETRDQDPNWILSHKQSKTKSHAGSSDCGCAFIAIDGATAACELTGNAGLKPLIENMIASYEILPREELYVQTHATLSGIRGILRYYRITGEQKYLDLAVKTFDLYKTKAWTDHYANYNWFGVPRWTEPCAVIDSFIISQELWEITGEEGYLRDAHHILYNAIAHAQRVNGAFGTDQCVGAKVKPPTEMWGADTCESDEAVIFARAQTYEVFWCCNMRGGDGLSRAAMYSFYTDGNSVTVPFFHTCNAELELETGTLTLHENADYPFDGKVGFQCLENTAGSVMLRFFAPDEWSSGAASKVFVNGAELKTAFDGGFVVVKVDLNVGDVVVFDTEMKFRVFEGNECINNSKDHFSFRHGPMMLGVHSVLENETADATEVSIALDGDVKSVGNGCYEIGESSGQSVRLQPMWGKENLIEPLDVYQVLFKK